MCVQYIYFAGPVISEPIAPIYLASKLSLPWVIVSLGHLRKKSRSRALYKTDVVGGDCEI